MRRLLRRLSWTTKEPWPIWPCSGMANCGNMYQSGGISKRHHVRLEECRHSQKTEHDYRPGPMDEHVELAWRWWTAVLVAFELTGIHNKVKQKASNAVTYFEMLSSHPPDNVLRWDGWMATYWWPLTCHAEIMMEAVRRFIYSRRDTIPCDDE